MTGPGPRGTGVGRLWAANAVSNVGDGIILAAGPLLVASLTDNPALTSFAVMVVFTACAWRLFSRSALDAERQQVGPEVPVT